MTASPGAAVPLVAAALLAGVGLGVSDGVITGPLASQMAWHILLMSGVALLLAVGLCRGLRLGPAGARPGLGIAVALQAGVLYFWHLPDGQALAMRAAWGMMAMQGTLLVAGTLFWLAVATSLASKRWHAVAALLVTGKLFCLLGVLLVFARRPLYDTAGGAVSLGDQQLAGLMMLGACPTTYVAAAFVIAWRGIPRSPHHSFVPPPVIRKVP